MAAIQLPVTKKAVELSPCDEGTAVTWAQAALSAWVAGTVPRRLLALPELTVGVLALQLETSSAMTSAPVRPVATC